MKYLVVGGGGFIGASLCDELLRLNKKVRILDFKESANTVRLANAGAQVIIGDFQYTETVVEALTDIDLVFHLASTTVPKTSRNNHIFDVQSNVVGTLKLLNIAKELEIKKIVFASSGGTVYGIPEKLPLKENHQTNPIVSYGITKLTIEKYLHMFWVMYGLDYTILRIANAFGAGQKPTGIQGVIPSFIHKVLLKEEVEVWGNGSVIRDYIYISDVVRALIVSSNYKGDEKIFNIGRGEGYSLNNVLSFIKENIWSEFQIKRIPHHNSGSFDVPENVLNISLAIKKLAWRPEISVQDGIMKTHEWMKDNYQKW